MPLKVAGHAAIAPAAHKFYNFFFCVLWQHCRFIFVVLVQQPPCASCWISHLGGFKIVFRVFAFSMRNVCWSAESEALPKRRALLSAESEALPQRKALWSAESEALPQRIALWSAESEANNDDKSRFRLHLF